MLKTVSVFSRMHLWPSRLAVRRCNNAMIPLTPPPPSMSMSVSEIHVGLAVVDRKEIENAPKLFSMVVSLLAQLAQNQQQVINKTEEVAAVQQQLINKAEEVAAVQKEVTAVQKEVTSKAEEVAAVQKEVTSKAEEVGVARIENITLDHELEAALREVASFAGAVSLRSHLESLAMEHGDPQKNTKTAKLKSLKDRQEVKDAFKRISKQCKVPLDDIQKHFDLVYGNTSQWFHGRNFWLIPAVIDERHIQDCAVRAAIGALFEAFKVPYQYIGKDGKEVQPSPFA